jgi:hypothetical protein
MVIGAVVPHVEMANVLVRALRCASGGSFELIKQEFFYFLAQEQSLGDIFFGGDVSLQALQTRTLSQSRPAKVLALSSA